MFFFYIWTCWHTQLLSATCQLWISPLKGNKCDCNSIKSKITHRKMRHFVSLSSQTLPKDTSSGDEKILKYTWKDSICVSGLHDDNPDAIAALWEKAASFQIARASPRSERNNKNSFLNPTTELQLDAALRSSHCWAIRMSAFHKQSLVDANGGGLRKKAGHLPRPLVESPLKRKRDHIFKCSSAIFLSRRSTPPGLAHV